MKKKWIILSLFIGLSLSTLSAFVWFDKKDNSFEIAKNLDIYYSLFRELNIYYVDEIDPGEVIKNSIDAMLKKLDPYTVYIPESQIEDYKFMTTGEYGGVGAIISTMKDRVLVREVYKGEPMYNAGVQVGDEILEIDDVVVEGKDSEAISELVKGAPNSEVEFLIKRAGSEKPLRKTVTRAKIHIPNVPHFDMLNDKTGYIKLDNFTRDAASNLGNALDSLRSQGDLEAVVVDLRDNPGGLLREAVSVVSLFVPQGEHIVSTKGRLPQWNQKFATRTAPIDTTIRVAVLVNSKAASASEIVAGAMQDLDRGVILGQRSFGKGLVQATRDLSYDAKLKITTAKYYIPSGRCIQALDYSHRREDGSVGKVPDSLISEFKTRNGRVVFDGGGIRPDVELPEEDYAEITRSLIRQNVIFDFVTQWNLEHESPATMADVQMDDALYQSFMDYTEEQEFSYQTQSEKKYKELVKVTKREKYYQKATEELEALEDMLAHDIDKDLRIFRPEIEQLIRYNIISRYFYQKGHIQTRLKDDPWIDSTLQVLDDTARYKDLLTLNSN